jgi:hypothetical protein
MPTSATLGTLLANLVNILQEPRPEVPDMPPGVEYVEEGRDSTGGYIIVARLPQIPGRIGRDACAAITLPPDFTRYQARVVATALTAAQRAGEHEPDPRPAPVPDHAFEGDGQPDATLCWCGKTISEHLRH